ncbi:hypothetical protein OEZ86_013863 [Tetradesmus obliquus]|nr:hypothetical protein OEZ86_013863 [Tetradesmus obliquus]
MKASYMAAALFCLALCTDAIASSLQDAALPSLDVQPGGLRQLQGDDLDDVQEHMADKSSDAVDAMKYMATAKLEGVQTFASDSAEAAARAAKRIQKADARLAGVVSTTSKNTAKATGAALAATTTDAAVRMWDAATPHKGPIKEMAAGVAKFALGVNAKIKTKEAERTAAWGAKRVKRATAKNADSHADALRDAAEDAAHAAKKAALRDAIFKQRAAMAVSDVAKSVLKP